MIDKYFSKGGMIYHTGNKHRYISVTNDIPFNLGMFSTFCWEANDPSKRWDKFQCYCLTDKKKMLLSWSRMSYLGKITNWSNTWNMSFNPDKSYTLTMSLRKDRLENPPIHFLNNPLEEVLSFRLLGLAICHDLSWESHISNLASKASRRLGILRRAKSFLGPPEFMTTCKAFVHNLMEYCSPLWAGAPASHLYLKLHPASRKRFVAGY